MNRTFVIFMFIGAAVFVTSCSSQNINSASTSSNANEPAALGEGQAWLSEIEDEVRFFAEKQPVSRSLANKKTERVFDISSWTLNFGNEQNNFWLKNKSSRLDLIQVKISEIDSLEFVTTNQKNPLSLKIYYPSQRSIASSSNCKAEIRYWNFKRKSYNQRTKAIGSKTCAKVFQLARGL